MFARIHVIGAAGLLLGLAACSGGPSPYAPVAQHEAGASGSYTAYRGPAPTVSPSDPAYSENGAPRAGQPAGTQAAGRSSYYGNFGPILDERDSSAGGKGP